MSKIEHITEGNVEIFLFDGVENLNGLEVVQPQIKMEFLEAHSDTRKAELLALSKIWNAFFEGIQFERKPTGKPICDQYNLSISHHGKYFSLARSKKPVGIDVEGPRTQLVRIQKKFLHPSEAQFAADVEKLQLIWSVKEVVYKIYDDDQMFFWRDIKVTEMDLENNLIQAEITHQNVVSNLKFKFINLDDGVKMVFNQ